MPTIDYIKPKTKRRSGAKLKALKFIVAHDTGNPNSTARNNVDYYKNSCNEMSASAHVFIDDKETIECIPLNEKAWHVRYDVKTDNAMFGFDANDYAIGVELCYFPKDIARSTKAYNTYVKYIADLLKANNLDPRIHVVGHYTLDPARKTDPVNAFKFIKKTWGNFIDDLTKEFSKK